ncbi:MAG: glycosyltransferase family 2 protein, partial [Planctomycetota bacterium]
MAELNNSAGEERGRPLVSVVVCTLGQRDLLVHALQSLAEQGAPREDFEVIVVDNAPAESTRLTVESFGGRLNCRCVAEPRRNMCLARNTG